MTAIDDVRIVLGEALGQKAGHPLNYNSDFRTYIKQQVLDILEVNG